jgi:arginase
MAILQALGVVSCVGGSLRLCSYAAEMLRDEFSRDLPEQKRLQIQWQLLHPESQGLKAEKLAKLNKAIH